MQIYNLVVYQLHMPRGNHIKGKCTRNQNLSIVDSFARFRSSPESDITEGLKG